MDILCTFIRHIIYIHHYQFIGANGNIGKHLGKTLAERGDEPIGFIRKEEQAPELNQLGVKTELANIIKTGVSEYASKFQSIDALIFTASAGVELTKGKTPIQHAVEKYSN
ncbi:NAD(P)H-binding protein [Mammaliicoccus sp. P-M56]|uniref:NAD(P)H-binding protein n=1 Tax=Mammaliicoccus sp. P-M56 TaxID=2898715 RepID=UPI001EFA4816